MIKGNLSKKLFNLTHLGIKIITVIMFAIYLREYFRDKSPIFLSFLAPLMFFVISLLYNLLLVHFHKKGFYTPEQAVEFYEKCREQNISLVQEENLEKATDIYFSIFGTDRYIGDGTLIDHMGKIYNAGKK